MSNIAPIIAGMFALWAYWQFRWVDPRSCVQCGGTGKHRRNCPFDKDA